MSVYGLHVVFCMLGRMVWVSGVFDVCIVCYPYNMYSLHMWFVYIRHKYMWLVNVVCVSLGKGDSVLVWACTQAYEMGLSFGNLSAINSTQTWS